MGKNRVQYLAVLSIKQPWAQLIIDKKKNIEIRTWTTDYRGELYIHTGRNPDKFGLDIFGYEDKNLIHGALIGKCILTDVINYDNRNDFVNDTEKHLNLPEWYRSPLFGFLLQNCQKITPIHMKGKPGIFQYTVNNNEKPNKIEKKKEFTILDYF